MSRHNLAVNLTLLAATLSVQVCQAKPDDTTRSTASGTRSSEGTVAGTGDGSKSTAGDGSKSFFLPGVSGSSMVVAKAPTIDVSKPYGYHLEPILQKISANTEQRTKIVAVVQSYKSKIQPLLDEYQGKRQEFIAIMTGGGAAESIMAKQMELSHLASEITSKYTLMRLEIRRMLTPQQILQFEDYARQHGWNSH